jgi:hypothetical protein
MPTVDFTLPAWRPCRPVCVAVHKGGRWTSLCLYGPDEHRSPATFPTREAALADAKRIAATLARDDAAASL